jgi:hypothetical protein
MLPDRPPNKSTRVVALNAQSGEVQEILFALHRVRCCGQQLDADTTGRHILATNTSGDGGLYRWSTGQRAPRKLGARFVAAAWRETPAEVPVSGRVAARATTLPPGFSFGNEEDMALRNSNLGAVVSTTTTRYQRADPRGTLGVEVSQLVTPVDDTTMAKELERVELMRGQPFRTEQIAGHEAQLFRTSETPGQGLVSVEWQLRPGVWITVIGREHVEIDELLAVARGLTFEEDPRPFPSPPPGSTTTRPSTEVPR